jgi:glycine/D-amino acid oxidase-like deaminating enzyme
VIVGGGITGALIAYVFAKAGVSAAVLERDLVCRGSTAASSALLLSEPDLEFLALTRRYGLSAGKRIWRLGQEAVRELTETLKKLRIPCDLAERETIYLAANRESAARLCREHAARSKAGLAGAWLSASDVRRAAGVAADGAICTPGAQFNPYRACAGVMSAAARAGAMIFERSAVTRVVRRGAGVRVHTRHGRLDACTVIIATGYATPSFRPLAGRFRMYRTYALATEPLTAAARRDVGLGDVMIWDTDRPYHYARWTADGRLLVGGGDRRFVSRPRADLQFADATRELREDFTRMFPALNQVSIEHAWEGLFAMTPDSLPYIGAHRRYPRHLFALGYGGNGMTFGFLAARLLLEHWHDKRSIDHRLFGFGRHRG